MRASIPMPWCVVLSLLAAGCYPDLSGYEVVRSGDAGSPLPGVDAGPPRPGVDAGEPRPVTGGPCGRPTLFIAARSLGDAPSQILRYELHGTGGVVPCGPALAEDELVGQPFSLAAVSERFVLLASRGGVDGVDPVEDTRLFHLEKPSMHPNDAFAVDDPGRGDRVAAVAWSRMGVSAQVRGTIVEIDAYSTEGAVRRSWTGSDFNLGQTTAIAASHRAPSEAIAVNSNTFAAAELDLWGLIRREPALLGPFASTALDSLHAGRGADGRERFVYTGLVETEPSIVIVRDPYLGADDLARTGLCESQLCDPVHAVVDPTVDDGVIAICEYDGGYEIQRFDLGRSLCETFVAPTDLGGLRPSYLSILE